MYRISELKEGEKTLYVVRKNRKWIIPWKWHDCKLEVFYGPGIVVYPAIFQSRDEAEKYIEHKGSKVNAMIPGFRFYVK